MKERTKTIEKLLHILSLSCQLEQWQIARDTLDALLPYGFVYREENNTAVFAISGTVYHVPLRAERKNGAEIPDFTPPASDGLEQPREGEVMTESFMDELTKEEHFPPMPKEQPMREPVDELDKLDEALPSDGLLANILKDIGAFSTSQTEAEEPAQAQAELRPQTAEPLFDRPMPEDAFGGMFQQTDGLDELEELERTFGAAQEKEKEELPSFFEGEAAAADVADEPESRTEAPAASFSRTDADNPPEKTSAFRRKGAEQAGETEHGFLPPLTADITNNFEIPLADCAYSIFLADVYEEQSLTKQRIFFMVAPFEVTQDSPSTNILFYAYTDHTPYCTTSLKNHDKNSLVCQIGRFQFLVRGYILDGKWRAEVKLTGESLRRGDVLEINQEKHFSPESLGTTNGHIRFRYKGYINRADLISTGCVNVFPIDPNTKDCVIVRCMEDFIDYAFTDQSKEMVLHTAEDGEKQLHVSCDDNMLRVTFSDYTETEEGELT